MQIKTCRFPRTFNFLRHTYAEPFRLLFEDDKYFLLPSLKRSDVHVLLFLAAWKSDRSKTKPILRQWLSTRAGRTYFSFSAWGRK